MKKEITKLFVFLVLLLIMVIPKVNAEGITVDTNRPGITDPGSFFVTDQATLCVVGKSNIDGYLDGSDIFTGVSLIILISAIVLIVIYRKQKIRKDFKFNCEEKI